MVQSENTMRSPQQCVAVQTDMEPLWLKCGSCVSEQNMLLYLRACLCACVCVCIFMCYSYSDRLSPCGLVVNLSWAERRRLCGCGRL